MVLQELHYLLQCLLLLLWCVGKYVYTKFCNCCERSYMAIHVPLVRYGLRLFVVVLQELHCLPNYLHVCMIRVITSPSFSALYLWVSEIAKRIT